MIKQQTKSELIMASLLDLLEHHSFESITVKDIIENCGISRKTFYNCFRDKYDLIVRLYFSEIANPTTNCHDYLSYLEDIYQTAKDHSHIWKKILPDPLCCQHIQSSLFDIECEFFKVASGMSLSNYLKNLFKIHSTGTFHVVHDWIMTNCKESPNEIARLTINSIPSEVKHLYLGF